MKNTKFMFKEKENLKEIFNKSLKDDVFSKLIESLKVDKSKLYKHTSALNDSKEEIINCTNCKGLSECKNELCGYRKIPVKDGEDISFTYKACKYKDADLKKNSYKKNLDLYKMPPVLKEAKMKDIYTDDKARLEAIKYIDNFCKNYPEINKGIYLHGNFGCGKTYLIAALFNELAKKGIKSSIIYYPEFLRDLKASFQNKEDTSFADKYEYIKTIPYLLIDDIGAENVTAWGRDEILGTLLQYRMNEKLSTFFTSNLTLNELESHLSLTSKTEDKVKARRITERIKCLSEDIEIIGKNRR